MKLYNNKESASKKMADGVNSFLKKCEDEKKIYINDKNVNENVLDITKYLRMIFSNIYNHNINSKKTSTNIMVNIIGGIPNSLGINCKYINISFNFKTSIICIDIDSDIVNITPTENQLNLDHNRKHLFLLCLYKNEIESAVNAYYKSEGIYKNKIEEFNILSNKLLSKRVFDIF